MPRWRPRPVTTICGGKPSRAKQLASHVQLIASTCSQLQPLRRSAQPTRDQSQPVFRHYQRQQSKKNGAVHSPRAARCNLYAPMYGPSAAHKIRCDELHHFSGTAQPVCGGQPSWRSLGLLWSWRAGCGHQGLVQPRHTFGEDCAGPSYLADLCLF
eukprot:361443-Chlamydomonas_euryale.AAC.2